MPPAVRRNRRVTTRFEKLASAAFGVLGSIGMMMLLVLLLDPEGCGISDGYAATAKPTLARVDLDTTCNGDVLLATAGRAAMCMAPWRDAADLEACTDDLQLIMQIDLSACRGKKQGISPVAMAMVEPKAMEKITPIDPEPLIEELIQQQMKPPTPMPPPPVPQPQQAQPKPPPPPPQQRPAQVVETVKPNTEEEPKDARFLAEYNTKVEKQKVARGTPKEPMVAKSQPKDLTPTSKPKDDPSMVKPPEQDPGKNPKAPQVPGTLAMRPPGAPAPSEAPQDPTKRGTKGPQGPISADGFIPRRGDGAIEQQRKDPGEQTKGQGGAGGGTPQAPNLKPTKEQLERVLGGGNVDHLEEISDGDETALSAKRWVYASFFNRMKRQVAQNWDPQTVWRRTDPQGTHHGFKTRVTEVRVSLNAKGDLSKIVVIGASGVTELDDEAVRAFHAAAPFPNPPDGLVQKDGMITFAFSFFFEIGQPHTSWRVIRSN